MSISPVGAWKMMGFGTCCFEYSLSLTLLHPPTQTYKLCDKETIPEGYSRRRLRIICNSFKVGLEFYKGHFFRFDTSYYFTNGINNKQSTRYVITFANSGSYMLYEITGIELKLYPTMVILEIKRMKKSSELAWIWSNTIGGAIFGKPSVLLGRLLKKIVRSNSNNPVNLCIAKFPLYYKTKKVFNQP